MMISRSKHRSSVEICSDCGASDPSWASINRGLLLCAECCSVHRSMGRHISHVKSLRQGSWPPSLLAMVQALTAQNVNSIWEYSLLDATSHKHLRKKPQPKDPLHPVKSEFILAKHLRLTYVLRARRDEPASELGRQLHSAVRSFSLDTAMRLLAQGADPNYYNPEKGSTCLHVACRAGQPAQAELLVAWGADPTAKDSSGNTPAECARQGGHTELAERMVELVYEATDRLIHFLSGEKPDHASGRHYIIPRTHDTHEMTDVAKAARGKLQLLPNHLFEELVMDIYDEVDRRETEAIWQTSAVGLERVGVAFLPVNPALSAPRNQGRQKLARLLAPELAALARDVLLDAARRQRLAELRPRGPLNPVAGALKHISQVSDDEPLYDSVASDDDYASLAPIDLNQLQLTSLDLNTTDAPPTEHSTSVQTQDAPPTTDEIETLRKELDSRNSTINELKNQLKSLQTIVEQLTKENSVLKTSSVDDEHSVASHTSDSADLDLSPDREPPAPAPAAPPTAPRAPQRPVSMFEAREGPKNNWQVTKHQLTTIPVLERSLTQSVLEGGARGGGGGGGAAGSAAGGEGGAEAGEVQARAEAVTRCIQELWACARTSRARLPDCAANIERAVDALLALFPPSGADAGLQHVLDELRAAGDAAAAACGSRAPIERVRASAYDLAKAVKLLLTRYPPP